MTPGQPVTELVPVAANLATVTDIAARAGSPEDAAAQWVELKGFPQPLIPEAAGGRVWWWPAARKFILSHAAELPGYVPPPDTKPASRPRPAGKRGPDPGPRVLSPFDMRQLHAMHSQVGDRGEARFTLEQIAAALPGNVTAATVHQYAPARRRPAGGQGGDARALPPKRIAEIRALRTERTPAGNRRHTLEDLAGRFSVTGTTIYRYCLDLEPPRPRRSRLPAFDAEGNLLTDDLIYRVQVMRAKRDADGERLYTREQVAAECGVSAATVGRLERNVTAPPAGRGETHGI